MDYNPPISADELKSEFDKLKDVFIGSDSDAKFNASAQMMVLISRYLSHNIEAIDVYPITTVLAEFARIGNGGQPEFIQSQKKLASLETEKNSGGHPIYPQDHMYRASIVAAVDILSKNGYSIAGATRFVAEELGRSAKQVKQLRADFNRRKVLEEAEEFKRTQMSFVFVSERHAKIHVMALLAMVKAGIK